MQSILDTKICDMAFAVKIDSLSYVKFGDKIIFVTFRSFGCKFKIISNKSPKKILKNFWSKMGEAITRRKINIFLIWFRISQFRQNQPIVYFFYSFEKLFFLGAWVLNNFFSGNFFQKWSIFAVFRLFVPERRPIRKNYFGRDRN